MKLRELLDQRRVVVPLEARNLREATAILVKALVAAGDVSDQKKLAELVRSAWPEDVVSVSGRAFLPHFRTNAVKQVALAVGVTPDPVSLRNDPNRTARIVVLIVAPVGEASAYLRTMSAVAQALSSDETLASLHAARGPGEVLAIPGLAEAGIPDEVTVADVMTSDVTAVTPKMPLREAAQAMLARSVRAVPVIGPNREVVGLLTDAHLLNYLLPLRVSELSTGQMRAVKRKGKSARAAAEPGDVPVREVMDRSVLCLSEDQSVADVAALMLAKEADRFPVTRDGALVGFLTRGDIVRKLLGG